MYFRRLNVQASKQTQILENKMKLEIFGKRYFPMPYRLEVRLVQLTFWQSFWAFLSASPSLAFRHYENCCRILGGRSMRARVSTRKSTPLGDPRGIPKVFLLRIKSHLVLGCLEGFGARTLLYYSTLRDIAKTMANSDAQDCLLPVISGNALK